MELIKEEERTAVLKGKEAKDFLEYMSKPLSSEEKRSLKDAYDFYKKHCPVDK